MAEKLLMSSKLKKVVSYCESSDDDEDSSGLEASLNKLNLGAKKKLLVLPLGGFLVHRVHVRDKVSVRGYKPDYEHHKFLLFKRPFSSDFLKFCFERFEVGIWSSAREHNVDAALSGLFGPLAREFAFVWVDTSVFLDDYKVNNDHGESFLGPKGEFRAFLDGLTDAEDVPSYLKEHPFGQPPITTEHPDWVYYSKIVEIFRERKAA